MRQARYGVNNICAVATGGNLSRVFGNTLALPAVTSFSQNHIHTACVASYNSSSFFIRVTGGLLQGAILVTPVDTSAGAGLTNLDGTEQREGRFQVLPDPARNIFTGRVFQARNIVEVMMIQHDRAMA